MAYDARKLSALEQSARRANGGPDRFYHTVQHVDDCLAKLDGIAGLDERERRLLRMAIVWHDIVYDPTQSDNEERSAEWARNDLAGTGLSAEDIGEVARLILLTRGHRVADNDALGALMVSVDLSILGADPQSYRAYTDAIRQEYAHVPDDAFRKGRRSVLEQLLQADPLFPDPAFRARFEAQARENMTREIARLSAPAP